MRGLKLARTFALRWVDVMSEKNESREGIETEFLCFRDIGKDFKSEKNESP